MKYYLLKAAVDTKETGNRFPAVESVVGYNFNSINSVYKLRSDCFPNFIPDLRFNLASGSKLTDVLSQATISARGLLVSNRVIEIIAKYPCVPYEVYKTVINTKTKIEEYYWIHFVWEEGIELINYPKSTWYIKRISKNLGEINLTNRKDHLLKQGQLGFIKMIHGNPIVIKNPKYDIFYDPLNFGIHISEKVKNEFELNNISGIEIKYNKNLIIEY